MIVRDSAALTSDALQAFTRRLDSHPTLPGKLQLFSGPMPAAANGSVGSSVMLCEFTLPRPSLDVVAGNVLTVADVDSVTALATGEVAWGRFLDGSGGFVSDMDAGGSGSTAAIKLATVEPLVYAGGQVSVLSLTRYVES